MHRMVYVGDESGWSSPTQLFMATLRAPLVFGGQCWRAAGAATVACGGLSEEEAGR